MASSRSWTKVQIKDHTEAAERLGLIKDEVALFLQENKGVTERKALDFVKKRYKAHGLVNDDKKEFAIVAFGKNTSHVHYFPKGAGTKLKPNTLILLDMWARLDKKNAPYADMTWMFWYGSKVPKNILREWNVLKRSRDAAVEHIKANRFPRGLDIDRVAHDILGTAGYGERIKHTIGHSLGTKHPHGDLSGINWREYRRIKKNVGYTIEPGIYLADTHGLRSEIDFYINSKYEVIVTTPVQNNIDLL